MVIHGNDKKRKRAREDGPQECIHRDGTGAEAGEGVDKVVQGCLEDGREAEADEGNADDGGPEVDVFEEVPISFISSPDS